MYQLRNANDEDYSFVFNLNKAVYENYVIEVWGSWDDEFQRRFCENRLKTGNIKIIQYDKKEIGILELIQKDQIYIEEIQIESNSQGKGIGTEILSDIKQTACKLNESVGLQVLKVNRAKKLYEKLGFHVIGETETHFIMET